MATLPGILGALCRFLIAPSSAFNPQTRLRIREYSGLPENSHGHREPEPAVGGISHTKLTGLVLIALVSTLCFSYLMYWLAHRLWLRGPRSRAQRQYVNLDPPRHWSATNSWPRPPPTYEQSIRAEHIPIPNDEIIQQPPRATTAPRYRAQRPIRAPRYAIHAPTVVPVQNEAEISCQNQATTVALDPVAANAAMALHRVATQREIVIQMDREQALLRLEGNPLGGQHTNVVPAQEYRQFLTEMKLKKPKDAGEAQLETVDRAIRKPEPLKLRGGGGNSKSYIISAGSADDITQRIKDWFKEHTEETRDQLKRAKQHRDWIKEQRSRKHGPGILPWFLRKRVDRKKNIERVKHDRDDALAILEGRSLLDS